MPRKRAKKKTIALLCLLAVLPLFARRSFCYLCACVALSTNARVSSLLGCRADEPTLDKKKKRRMESFFLLLFPPLFFSILVTVVRVRQKKMREKTINEKKTKKTLFQKKN